MRVFRVVITEIIVFALTSVNFFININFCINLERSLGLLINSKVGIDLAAIGIFLYVLFQIGLMFFLNASWLKFICKKNKIRCQ